MLEEALQQIEVTIKGLGGSFSIQMAPKVVTAIDEAYLAKQMERLELENQEVAGDDDEEDEEGMGEANGNGDRKDEDEEEGDGDDDEDKN